MTEEIVATILAAPIGAAAFELARGLFQFASRLEIAAGLRSDARFEDVERFWLDGVDGHRIAADSRVRVSGLLMPYGPLTPAHPLQRPGASLEGWEAVGDLKVGNREAYDALDAIIYGDRVVRMSGSAHGKYYGGLYGYRFGRSDVALPLLIDAIALDRARLTDMWSTVGCQGVVAEVTGTLRQMNSYYVVYYNMRARELDRDLSGHLYSYPNFGLEVDQIRVAARQPRGVTHISASVTWRSGRGYPERTVTEYFDCRNGSEWSTCEVDLNAARRRRLVLDYDDLRYLTRELKADLPVCNEFLRNWVDNSAVPRAANYH